MPAALTEVARPTLTPAEIAEGRVRVRTLLENISTDVANLPRHAARDMYPALVEAERDVAAALQEWMETAPKGEERFTAHQYRRVLLQLRAARRAALKRVRKETPEWTKELEESMHVGLRRASWIGGRMATEHISEELATFSHVFGTESMIPISLNPARIIGSADKTLIPRHRTSAKRYADSVWQDMRNQFRVGLLAGETNDQLVRRLIRLGGPKGIVALRGVAGEPGAQTELIAEGLFRRYRHWADRVIRTEVINAYNVQADEGLREANDIDDEIKRRWDSSLDSAMCVVCSGLHAEVREVDEAFSTGDMHPPAHPNCRCAVVAWHESWAEDDKVETQQDRDLAAAEKRNAAEVAERERQAALLAQNQANVPTEPTRAQLRDQALPIVPNLGKSPDRLLGRLAAERHGVPVEEGQKPPGEATLVKHGLAERVKAPAGTDLRITKLGRAVRVEAKKAAKRRSEAGRKAAATRMAKLRAEGKKASAIKAAKAAREAKVKAATKAAREAKKAETEEQRKAKALEKLARKADKQREALKKAERMGIKNVAVKADGMEWDLRTREDGGIVSRDEEVIWVNTHKLDARWKADRVEASGKGEIRGRIEGFKHFLKQDIPIQPASISMGKDGTIVFNNGRHRTAVLKGMTTRMPVVVAKSEALRLQRQIGMVHPDKGNPFTRVPAEKSIKVLQKGHPIKLVRHDEESLNKTFIVDLKAPDGSTEKAIFKPRDGEVSVRGNVKAGTYWKREGAAWNVAKTLGVDDLVPPTVSRAEGRLVGSLQRIEAHEADAVWGFAGDKEGKVRKSDVERVRLFDYVMGNSDRHGGNLLYAERADGSMRPIMIDNGLSLPAGVPSRFTQPATLCRREDIYGKRIQKSTIEHIQKIDERELARKLLDSDIEPQAVSHAVARLRQLRLNPEILEVKHRDWLESRKEWLKAMEDASPTDDIGDLIQDLVEKGR